MKKRLVLWGKTPENERVLIAIGYDDGKSIVSTYVFTESEVTEEFHNQMMNLWREGNEVPFPNVLHQLEQNIGEASLLIPEGVTSERDDLIDKARAEWNYLNMSNKLASVYKAELEDIGDKINNARRYEQSNWDELRDYWNKVQQQIREKNLFPAHYRALKNEVNKLFDTLKSTRKEMDELLKKDSESNRDVFFKKLEEIEEKIKEGLSLQPLFEDLKGIQREFNKSRMLREHKNKVFKVLDGLFKEIKEKKFGDTGSKPGASKFQKRYDGLINAMKKMQYSIDRDKKELDFQDKRIESSDAGQLESQIRQAKIKMIEERMKSKQVKLDDMLKIKQQLESKIEAEKQKQEDKLKQQELNKKKEEAKKKIEEEMKAAEEARKAEEEKILKAAEKIAEGKPTKSGEKSESNGGEKNGQKSEASVLITHAAEIATTITALDSDSSEEE
jgi:hypothetical protein